MRYIFIFLTCLLLSNNLLAQSLDTTVTFKVMGACEMCEQRIESAAKGRGVLLAEWQVDSQLLTVRYNPKKASLQKIKDRIAMVGHDVDGQPASIEAYQKLPACCLYRNMEATGHGILGEAKPVAPQASQINHQESNPQAIDASLPGALVKGLVLQTNKKGEMVPLEGASVYWAGGKTGTATNQAGYFTLPFQKTNNQLVVSYFGYKNDTLAILATGDIKVIMADPIQKVMEEVVVTSKKLSTFVNSRNAIRVQTMSEKELFKAACCNLSESFETNPSVDVSSNDAVTGSRQVQMLGLSSSSTLLTLENLPGPRGLASPLGLTFVPGPWVESIQITKGMGSVANGFESIAGQINVELKKPQTAEPVYANVYINNMGKTDLNLVLTKKISPKWSTALLLHDNFLTNSTIDFNQDGFRDQPTGNQINLVNRWHFDSHTGVILQFGAKYMVDDRTGGQTDFRKEHKFSETHYGLGFETKRAEAFAKLGYVFPSKQYKSIGLQVSSFHHLQESYFGKVNYDAKQNNLYANLIYQSIIGNTNHKFRTGLSVVLDRYRELLLTTPYNRNENVSGAFFEYTFTPSSRFSLVLGLRGDYNNLYGFFVTPRIHLRYEPVKGSVWRIHGGRGQRTTNIFAENIGIFASNRNRVILPTVANTAYGLPQEVAWNLGTSFDQKLRLFNREAHANVDYFYTRFTSQVVVDFFNTQQVSFYGLQGKSYAHSLQSELSMQPSQHLEVRLSYRYFKVMETYRQGLAQKPLVARHRAFTNLAYTWAKWKADYTINYIGSKQLPPTNTNPQALQMPDRSKGYIVMNAQLTKTLGKKRPMDIYIGGENLGNFFQKTVIVDAAHPFGQYFDATMVWGPISGRMIYLGWRWKL